MFPLVGAATCTMVNRPRPPLSVIVQAFEVEPFPVCETRHLQIKRSKSGVSTEGQLNIKLKQTVELN